MMKKGAKVWSFIAILVFLFTIPSLCFVVMAGGVGVDGCLFGDQNIGKLEDLHSNSYQPKGANNKIITSLSTFEKGDKILNSKGDKGMILKGPVESDGINWFIRWEKESREGWSKENQLRKNDFYPSKKFSIDDQVEVCDSKGLDVRTDPPDLAWNDSVGEGTKGFIIEGPFYGIPKNYVLKDKKILYHFWKVKFGTITGWCAEGWPGGADYLKKVESPGIKSTEFKTGDFVRVIADAGRNIRTKPKLDKGYIIDPPSPLQKGSEGQVIEHQDNGVFNDGHHWWYLKFGVYDGWCAGDGLEKSETAPKVAKPVLTYPLKITPEKDKYYVGDTLTAQFTITNKGTKTITFDKITVGGWLNGECPDNKCPDFTFRSTALQPNDPYQYTGTLTLTRSGNYHFFIAFYIENPTPEEKKLLDENNWNTSVDLGDGLTDEDSNCSIKGGF